MLKVKAPKKLSKEGIKTRQLPSLKTSQLSFSSNKKVDVLQSVKNYLVKDSFEAIYKKEEAKAAAHIVFLLDTSGSMAANQQMGYVKGIIEQTIKKQRFKKVQYAMIVLDDEQAKIVQPFTYQHAQITRLNYRLKTRGKTNLGDAFLKVHELIKSIDKNTVQLFTFTDGKANIATANTHPFTYALDCYTKFLGRRITSSIIDTEQGVVKLGKAKELADKLRLNYIAL